MDVTDMLRLNETLPAFDLSGAKRIQREWKSLQDLDVLTSDGKEISTSDPKPTFISGFAVHQLVKEAGTKMHGYSGNCK
jgi:hypothetical protein